MGALGGFRAAVALGLGQVLGDALVEPGRERGPGRGRVDVAAGGGGESADPTSE